MSDARVHLLLSVEGVAEALSCGTTYVWELHRDGLLPAKKLGKLTRWELATVERFIASLPDKEQEPPVSLMPGRRKAGRPLSSTKQTA